MFAGVISFNQNLLFDTSNVFNMTRVFDGASSFKQNLGFWLTDAVIRCTKFCYHTCG